MVSCTAPTSIQIPPLPLLGGLGDISDSPGHNMHLASCRPTGGVPSHLDRSWWAPPYDQDSERGITAYPSLWYTPITKWKGFRGEGRNTCTYPYTLLICWILPDFRDTQATCLWPLGKYSKKLAVRLLLEHCGPHRFKGRSLSHALLPGACLFAEPAGRDPSGCLWLFPYFFLFKAPIHPLSLPGWKGTRRPSLRCKTPRLQGWVGVNGAHRRAGIPPSQLRIISSQGMDVILKFFSKPFSISKFPNGVPWESENNSAVAKQKNDWEPLLKDTISPRQPTKKEAAFQGHGHWLTAEGDDVAAVFMDKLACDGLLHDLFHLEDRGTGGGDPWPLGVQTPTRALAPTPTTAFSAVWDVLLTAFSFCTFPAVFSVGLRPATLHAELFFQDLCMMGFFGGVIRNATSFPDYVIQGNPPPIPPIRYWGSFRVLPVLFVCLLSVLIF